MGKKKEVFKWQIRMEVRRFLHQSTGQQPQTGSVDDNFFNYILL
jgi:hypothetical protein